MGRVDSCVWFFAVKVLRCFNMEEYYISQLHLTGRDLWGHMTSLIPVKMACCVWTKEETKYFTSSLRE